MSKKSNTNYGGSGCRDAVWNKAITIPGKNPDVVRYDAKLNEIRYNSYGKDTKYGWNIDHTLAKNHGGGNELNNLQPLQSSMNKSYGDSLHKPNIESYRGLSNNEIHQIAQKWNNKK